MTMFILAIKVPVLPKVVNVIKATMLYHLDLMFKEILLPGVIILQP